MIKHRTKYNKRVTFNISIPEKPSIHLLQVIDGLIKYAKYNNFVLLINRKVDHNSFICRLDLCEKVFIFDVMDGMPNEDDFKKLLEQSDYYYKRSSRINDGTIPLGLNIPLIPPRLKRYINDNDNFVFITGFKRFKQIAKYFIKGKTWLVENWIYTKKHPLYRKSSHKIIFCTRLWSAAFSDQKTLNDDLKRIELIRTLKREFGKLFLGGVEDGVQARALCPDLILPKRLSNRDEYIKRMKQAVIGITTNGLYDSIGWKMSEYVASGKAIVCEKLVYQIPNNFSEHNNYFSFTTIQECVQKVKYLLQNKPIRVNMQKNNKHYYAKNVLPQKIISNALNNHFFNCDKKFFR